MSNIDTIKNELENLAQKIRDCNQAYYIDNAPIISDAEYDLIFSYYANLESSHPDIRIEDSPTKTVGAKLSNNFKKY